MKEDDTTAVVIVNNSNSSCQLSKGMELGHVSGVEVISFMPQVSVLTEQSLPAADDLTKKLWQTVEEHKDTIVGGGLLTFGDTSNGLP